VNEQTIIPVFTSAHAIDGQFLSNQIQWPGGHGWLKVVGSFSGIGAVINVEAQVADAPLPQVLVAPHPDFPSGISAQGIYKFQSPKGVLSFTSPTLGVGETIDVEVIAIVI